MTEKEKYIQKWLTDLAQTHAELGQFILRPETIRKKLIREIPIDDIVPRSGHDIIIFIVENFWQLDRVARWAKFYRKKYRSYNFHAYSHEDVNSDSVRTCYNIILCQSKRRTSIIRKKYKTISQTTLKST
jgi:hypothetical protein